MNILEIENLKVLFPGVPAVEGVDITVGPGERVAIVGESGCGKSTLANALLGFVPITSGSIQCFGHTLDAGAGTSAWREVRRQMQTVFQDPFSSLSSRLPVWHIISEPLYISGKRNKHILRDRAAELAEKVGLSRRDLERCSFEFSGGQRQRIAIARALCSDAELIICDEPTSALDVSVHAQICNLLLDLREELGLTYLFISHNLSLIRHMTDHTAVMYLGQIMETGATRALLSAIPQHHGAARIILQGEAVSPVNPPDRCRFLGRCPQRCDLCRTTPLPPPCRVGADHTARCHLLNQT